MSRRLWQALFGVACAANLVLAAFCLWLLVGSWWADRALGLADRVGLGGVVALFAAGQLAAGLLLARARAHLGLAALAVLCLVGQALCLLVTACAWFAAQRAPDQTAFAQAPVAWLKGHRWVTLLAALLLVPVFVVQVLFLHRSQALQTEGEQARGKYRRKATPYHHAKNTYISTVVVDS